MLCTFSFGLFWNFRLAQTTEPPGQKPKVVNVVVVGPFEEEGIGVGSDVAKAKGEDLDTPDYLRGDRVRFGSSGPTTQRSSSTRTRLLVGDLGS